MAKENATVAVDAKIEAAIKRTVEERFEGSGITAIEISRGEDADGDSILTIKVVLSDKTNLSDFGGSRLPGLISHLRNALEKEGEHAFPLVRMMSKRDAKFLSSQAR
jgi:hypothetical protein